jgi:hypothetical protein
MHTYVRYFDEKVRNESEEATEVELALAGGVDGRSALSLLKALLKANTFEAALPNVSGFYFVITSREVIELVIQTCP